jgi:hypothetical protein
MPRFTALWYYHCFGVRSAVAISENPETLLDIHKTEVESPNSLYHEYADGIDAICLEPIDIYKYNTSTKKLDAFYVTDDGDNSLYKLYAINRLPSDDGSQDGDTIYEQGEVLVYLSKEQHALWYKYSSEFNEDTILIDEDVPSFFYLDPISPEPVKFDCFYADGIAK